MNANNSRLLLVNLGSPKTPTRQAVKAYLREFLSDRRVVDLHPALWQPILRGIILNVRPQKTAANYQKIWGEGEEAPLIRDSRQITTSLSVMPTTLAMRYGEPSVTHALEQMEDVEHIIILPMFPQYSSATTASVFDAVANYYRYRKNMPGLHFIRDYHDHPAYIAALADSVRQFQAEHGQPELLLISFHGLPARYRDEGDPYPDQCQTTARLLGEKLGLSPQQYRVCFQSRFGREAWLQPYADETLRALPGEGVRSVQMMSPGFSVDCLETLEELAIGGKELFMEAGGEHFGYIPCLNQANVALYDTLVQDAWH
jgi:protoporphyrin/coproporphyrin ferrochelatase